MALDNLALEVGHAPGGVGLDGGLGVLHHHHPVLVVGIGDGKGFLGQQVEKGLLGIAIVLEGLVIVEMVAGEVGEDASRKLQSADALLGDGMAGTLHKGIFAALLHHLGQQAVEFDGSGSGMVGGNGLAVDIVADGGEQAALVPHRAEHII